MPELCQNAPRHFAAIIGIVLANAIKVPTSTNVAEMVHSTYI